MMTPRENLLSLYRRQGYEKAPVFFNLCPEQEETFHRITGSQEPVWDYFQFPMRGVESGRLRPQDMDIRRFLPYYDHLKPGTEIDLFGVAHEPGSAACKHMTYMRSPLRSAQSLEEMQAYPYPDFTKADYSHQAEQVRQIHARGLAASGDMQCTVWEHAWYMRGMEELMMDMMTEDPMADYILDWVTDQSVCMARHFAQAGCDLLYLGDDVGMQRTVMMSDQLYCDYLKPRLKKVIRAAKDVNPDIVVIYHSCGYVEPFIPHFIDAGIDVLNPVQPECMDFKKLHDLYGNQLSFNGTIGTQSTMPFGTPDDVRRKVFENLEIAGDKGGLLCCPTHMLEPEVPWQNIEAYVRACEEFK